MADSRDRPLPEHVTTPLLTLITARSMDEDYAHVAQQRATAGEPPTGSPKPHWISVVVVGVLGLMMAVVAVQTDRRAEVDELGRAALIDQIELRRERVANLQSQAGELNDSIRTSVTRAAEIDGQLEELESNASRLEVRTGFSPVRGEGVRITVDNQPGVDVNNEIRDEDLAYLVDGLWAAGAEAIAINDQRINLLGGIRNTSRAIHVNGRPVNAPYVISVIGDNDTLQARLLESSQGQAWFALVNTFGFRYTSENVDDIRLPAAPGPVLRDVIEMDAAPNGVPEGEETAP